MNIWPFGLPGKQLGAALVEGLVDEFLEPFGVHGSLRVGIQWWLVGAAGCDPADAAIVGDLGGPGDYDLDELFDWIEKISR